MTGNRTSEQYCSCEPPGIGNGPDPDCPKHQTSNPRDGLLTRLAILKHDQPNNSQRRTIQDAIDEIERLTAHVRACEAAWIDERGWLRAERDRLGRDLTEALNRATAHFGEIQRLREVLERFAAGDVPEAYMESVAREALSPSLDRPRNTDSPPPPPEPINVTGKP